MQEIVFDQAAPYTAYVGSGAVSRLAEAAGAAVRGTKAAVVTDTGVPARHVVKVCNALAGAGYLVKCLALPAGEVNKNLAGIEQIYAFLYELGVTRADGIVAVGGGMAGDMAGFAAATYLRGLPFINVPTTLISQTDSAYGGKTGVDFLKGKNYVGSFYDPAAVVCDTDFLLTLDKTQRLCGMGEVIKYGAIASEALLSLIAARGEELPTDDMIADCVRIKRGFVKGDERDNGKRRALNFGHTFGHAIEAASGYTVPHGQAVAYGMLAAAHVGEKLGVTDPNALPAIEAACRACGLDTDWRRKASEAVGLIALDKKSDGACVDMVLPERIGKPTRRKIAVEGIEKLI